MPSCEIKTAFMNLFGVSGNKGCNAEDAISSPVNILIGIVTLHGLGLSRLVKFFPLSPTSKLHGTSSKFSKISCHIYISTITTN